jgi:excinuclease ABC subunit C
MILKQLQKLNLPDNSGIYIFKDSKKRPLYIGRATSLKDRVKSYFKEDLFETRGQRIVDMVIKAKSIDWQETTSVLEAIILESNLIKKYQPVYNIDEKDDKSSMYVVITDEEWPRVYLVRARDFEKNVDTNVKIAEKYGPFPNSGLIKEAMKIIR